MLSHIRARRRQSQVTRLPVSGLMGVLLLGWHGPGVASASFCDQPAKLKNLSYEVVAEYPHSTDAFTQGLIYYRGQLIESTGLYGSSSVRYLDIRTGKKTKHTKIDKQFFAEGIARLGDELALLTWQSGNVFVYDIQSLRFKRAHQLGRPAWGATHQKRQLLISDGSHQIRYYNWPFLTLAKKLAVTLNGKPLQNLNELEYVNGFLFANVWLTQCIAVIRTDTGRVVARLDLSNLVPDSTKNQRGAVLNGIAYHPKRNTFFVTGKLWPTVFEIRLASPQQLGW